MADKAKLLAKVIESALTSDVKNEENSSLKEQMQAFKDILIHDITPREFADIYAKTIAYGMFVTRLRDTTLDTYRTRSSRINTTNYSGSGQPETTAGNNSAKKLPCFKYH
ncbi:MAG: hypothetical protein NVSMB46_09730 [Candidatus Saccharimonadales bacterium]